MDYKKAFVGTMGAALLGAGVGATKGIEKGLDAGIKIGMIAGILVGVVGSKICVMGKDKLKEKFIQECN